MNHPPTPNRDCAKPRHQRQADHFNPALTHKRCPDDLISFVLITVDEDIAFHHFNQLSW